MMAPRREGSRHSCLLGWEILAWLLLMWRPQVPCAKSKGRKRTSPALYFHNAAIQSWSQNICAFSYFRRLLKFSGEGHRISQPQAPKPLPPSWTPTPATRASKSQTFKRPQLPTCDEPAVCYCWDQPRYIQWECPMMEYNYLGCLFGQLGENTN